MFKEYNITPHKHCCDYTLGPQIFVTVQAAIKEKQAAKEAKKSKK